MSRQVDRWLKKGRKNCAKGNHWYIMDYGKFCLCPICGKQDQDRKPGHWDEYNVYLVNSMKFKEAAV
jgi:hypothetical protein